MMTWMTRSKQFFTAGALAMAIAPAQAAVLDLGSAADYDILHFGGGDLKMSGKSTELNANLGLGSDTSKKKDSSLQLDQGSVKGGVTIGENVTGTVRVADGVISGEQQGADLSAAIADARTAIDTLTSYNDIDLTFGNVKDDLRIERQDDLTVVSMKKLELGGTEQLVLSGEANDEFIIRVDGKYQQSGSSSIVLEGLSASNVYFLLLGDGNANFYNNSSATGLYFGEERKFQLSGSGASVEGRFYGAFEENMTFYSGANFSAVDVSGVVGLPGPDAGAVAATEPMMLGLLGLVAVGVLRRRQQA